MGIALKELSHLFQPKPTEPDTTPSLREALSRPPKTIDSYYITPSLRILIKEILDTAVNQKGQGFWIRAEYGAGKTHFIAALTLLLTNHDDPVWTVVHDGEIKRDYKAPLSKLKLFPVTFSLLGAGETEAGDSLVRTFEHEIRNSLPDELKKKIPVTSEELAVQWFQEQAGANLKNAIAAFFKSAHGMAPDEFRSKEGAKKFGAEIIRVAQQEGFNINLKAAFRQRFAYLYDQITKLGGYDGMLFVVDEFRSWQDRHEGKASFEEGVQVLETLAYYLPVEENKNIILVVASQGDCPQKLMGSGQGDRFIVRELLSGKDQTDYGEIVCFRVRDLVPGKEIEIEEYFRHCREKFRFLKQTTKDYFQAIFPFQPRCFDILRRVTQSHERYGLPSARSGIHIAWETLRHDGLLASRRLGVLSDLLNSQTLTNGLRSEQFRSSYESYQDALEALNLLPMDEEERDSARRIIGTLYLWSIVNADAGRGMTLNDLAEATMTSLEGVKPEDAVLDLVTQLKSDIPQIKYDKEKGARFEITEGDSKKPERVFGNFKKKGKTDKDAQDKVWREGLFWDFKALEGVGSEEGYHGGFFDGYGSRDAKGELILPNTTAAKSTPGSLKVQYGGEVVVADRWQGSFGEPWSNKPEVHFRIAYLTAQERVDKADLQDTRIAVCIPAQLHEDTRENLAEYVACKLMLDHYNDKDFPNEGALRDWVKTRRRSAIAAILKNQIEEFRRGSIITQKELGLPASQFFMTPQKIRGKREEMLAAQLLEKAYDEPLFSPKELKKEFTDTDARKVFHGLFAKTPSNADQSARDNFAVGMGLVSKNNPTQFAPQPGSAVLWVQEKARSLGDVSLAELVKELCRPPHALTEDIVRLAALAAVRAGNPPLMVAELNPAASFRLTTGKEPPGRRLKSSLINQVEWNNKLEKALLGARLKVSDEKPFNDVLPYAQVLDPNLTPANTPDEETARNNELCLALRTLAQDLPDIRDNLQKLAGILGGNLDEATCEAFSRLEAISATADYQEFDAVVRESYPTPELFQAAHGFYERGKRFTARYPELTTTKSYLDGLARLGDKELEFQAQSLQTQLNFNDLWKNEAKLGALQEQSKRYKEKYSLAYRKAHRAHHEALDKLHKELLGLDDQLTVVERLNGLDLGAAVGAKLAAEVETLKQRVRPCALKDQANVDHKPRCGNCHWDGQTTPPQETAGELKQRVGDASKELCKRVAQGAIRKILEESGKADVKTLLDMITASKVEELAKVLTPDMVCQLKGILAAANVEHRDLALNGLLEEFTVLEEDRVEEFLKRLRERLLANFDKAKKDTEGKKRIRFFLK